MVSIHPVMKIVVLTTNLVASRFIVNTIQFGLAARLKQKDFNCFWQELTVILLCQYTFGKLELI